MSRRKTNLLIPVFFTAVIVTSCCLYMNHRSAATSALFRACATRNHEMALQALDDGADVNAIAHFGWHSEFESDSVLTTAMAFGDATMVKILIERGTDVNMMNGHGETPLKKAESLGKQDIVKLLVTAGARP